MGGTPPWCKVKNIELTVGFVDFWPFGSIFNRFGLTVNALVILGDVVFIIWGLLVCFSKKRSKRPSQRPGTPRSISFDETSRMVLV